MAYSNSYAQKLVDAGTFSVLVANGATISNELDCKGASPIALQIPSAFDACDLTFKTSLTGAAGTYKTIKDPTNSTLALAVAVTADDHQPLDPSIFAGVKFLQIICSVAQTANRQIDVIMGPVWS